MIQREEISMPHLYEATDNKGNKHSIEVDDKHENYSGDFNKYLENALKAINAIASVITIVTFKKPATKIKQKS